MLFRGLIAAASCGALATAFASGYDYCGWIPHGTYVTDASPEPYAITVSDSDGHDVTAWTPGATYTVQLAATADARTLQGFVIAPFAASAAPSSFAADKAGILLPLDSKSRDMAFCEGGCTHSGQSLKTSVSFQWTTPTTGFSPVTIVAHVVECRYCNGDGLNHRVALTLPLSSDAAAASPSPVPAEASPAASASSNVVVAASPAVASSPSSSSGSGSSGDSGEGSGGQGGIDGSGSETEDNETDGSSGGGNTAASPSPNADDSSGSGTDGSESSDSDADSSAPSFPHSIALSSSLTLRWRLTGSDGSSTTSSAAVASAKRVTFRLEYVPQAQSQPNDGSSSSSDSSSSSSTARSDVWLAFGRASCEGMLNNQLPGGCSGPVAMGLPRYNVTKMLLLVGRSSSEGAVALPSSAAKVAASLHTGLLIAGVNGSTGNGGYLQFSRPLALPQRAHASELTINATAKQGFIWAVGGAPEFGMHRQSGFIEITLGSTATACSRGATCSGRGTCVRASLKATADEAAAAASSGGVCVCDLGYTGPDCSSCATGYARRSAASSSSASAACTLASGGGSASSDSSAGNSSNTAGGAGNGNGTVSGSAVRAKEADLEVLVTLRLALPFAKAGPAGSPERQAFINTLRSQMAAPLRIPPSRLQVRSLAPGSIIATVAILPASSTASSSTSSSSGGGSGSGSTTSTTNATSAPALAEQLAQLAADSTSALYTGNVTGALDSSVPLEFEVSAAVAAPPGYTGTAALGSALVLSWHRPSSPSPSGASNSGNDLVTFRLDYDGSSGDVWFAAGINSEAKMVGADVIAYIPSLADTAGTSTSTSSSSVPGAGAGGGGVAGATAGYPPPLQQLVLSALSDVGVRIVDPSAVSFTDVSIERATDGSNAVSVTFSRPMAAGAYPGSRALPSNGSATVVYAVGKRGQRSIARHASNAAGGVQVDFSTGETLAVTVGGGGGPKGRTAVLTHTVHGVLMFVAWGLLAPLGAFFARFCKRASAGAPTICGKPLWFALHRAVQVTAVVLSVGGFVIAVMMTHAEGQFSRTHHLVGVVVFALGLLQVALATCRPQPPKPGQPASQLRAVWAGVHTVIGYGTVILGAAAIFLGLPEAEAADGFTYAYGVWVALFAVAFAVFEAGRCRGQQPVAKPHHQAVGSSDNIITHRPASAPPADEPSPPSAPPALLASRASASAGVGSNVGSSSNMPAVASGSRGGVSPPSSASAKRVSSAGRKPNRDDPVALTAMSP